MDAGAARSVGFCTFTADIIPEVFASLLVKIRLRDLGYASGADHFGQEGISVFVEVLAVGEWFENAFGLFPLNSKLMDRIFAGEFVEVFEGFGHPAVFDLFYFCELIAVITDALFDPIREFDRDVKSAFALSEFVRSYEGFEKFMHAVPGHAVESIWFEFDFRGGEEIFAAESLLAFGEFIDYQVDLGKEFFFVEGLQGESGQVVCFEESREGAVWFGCSPATEWFSVFGGQAGLDAKGQQSAIRADGIEDLSVRLDALVEGPLVKELHIGGEWFGPWCAGVLVGQKFAERAMQECEC